MSWADDLRRLADKGGYDLGELARAVKIELFSGTSLDTRVDTGRLRGNWQIQESTIPSGTLKRLDPTGAQVSSEIVAKSSRDGVTYFVNNLPYAKKFEELDAMVARNVARVRHNVKEQIRDLRR